MPTNFYVFEGNPQPLYRVDTARIVKPARADFGHVAARLARSTRLSIDTAAPSGSLIIRGDAAKLAEVAGYDDVHATRAVFRDGEGHELALSDEILIAFSDESSAEDREALLTKLGCPRHRYDGALCIAEVDGIDEDEPLRVANALASEAIVSYAEPNFIQAGRLAGLVPWTEPRFARQWHLENSGQRGGVAGADVGARGAWKLTLGDPSIRVVIHDSGVDIAHPDLAPNVLPGWDFDHGDADPRNPQGPHGTACAGVIAAAVTGSGVVGIAPQVKIVPLRAAASHSWLTWANTFHWGAAHGDIISCSWSISRSETLVAAIRQVAREGRNGLGLPIFCATGNERQRRVSFPAHLDEVIAVGASNNQDQLASYSNGGEGIDLLAPSNGGTLAIETTDNLGQWGYSPGDYCEADQRTGFGGTSSATPLVAGVAALMLSVNPRLHATEVREILISTAVKIEPGRAEYGPSGWSITHGYGRVDAAAAVQMARDRA